MELITRVPAKRRIAAEMRASREHTHDLVAGVDDDRLGRQHDPLLSPLVWDLGHVGVYEELWLVQALTGERPADERRMHVYDAFENPRKVRGSLALMSRDEIVAYRDRVREQVLGLLEECDLDSEDPLLRNGYVYEMVLQHEHQHTETMLQALQLLPEGYRPRWQPLRQPSHLARRDTVSVAAGRYPVGNPHHEPYDNEHPVHEVSLRGFRIDRFPVTCGDFLGFMADGGYDRRQLWSDGGWRWRTSATGAAAPKHWRLEGTEWVCDRFGYTLPLDPTVPVMHVGHHEAEAYARWAGGRLPTEQEWEVAASWDPKQARARRYPWGDEPPTPELANLDQRLFGPAPIGSYPAGASALGCEQMVGDVWEWTRSDFSPYPGFVAFPYREYSEVFFGTAYKVLRGASWAARSSVARASFRNWDFPIRRQIFAGFRCAYPEERE